MQTETNPAPTPRNESPWPRNRAIGWSSLLTGVLLGLLLGMWSFDGPLAVPALLGDYDETPRRLLRLGHIAFFGLGFMPVAP